jgi:hypothetical protein
VYRPGADNRAADALSRHPSPFAICDVVTSLVPSWISAVLASYRNDSFVTSLLSKLALDPEVLPITQCSRACSAIVHASGLVMILLYNII